MSNNTGERGELSEQEKQELFQGLLSGSEYVYPPASLSYRAFLCLLILVETAHCNLILRKQDGFALRLIHF
jgi:hypothetical protein